MAKFELEVWGESVLLEGREKMTGGLHLLGKNAKVVCIAKLGPDVPPGLFEIGDEVKLHHDAKILASEEADYEFAVMRTWKDIACKVKRSLIE